MGAEKLPFVTGLWLYRRHSRYILDIISISRFKIRKKGTNISAVFQTQEDQSPVKTHDDVPPPPPTRVTSLPEYRRSNAVEASSDEDDGDDVDDIDEELAALIDDDDERPPELPPKKGTPTDFDSVFNQQDEDDEERWVCHRRTG